MFKLGTTDIYVRPILKMHADLKPLSDLVVSTNDLNSLELPFNMKPPKGWSVEWGMDDDVALLRGIYRYGMGSWEAIKLDPEYSFAEKVQLFYWIFFFFYTFFFSIFRLFLIEIYPSFFKFWFRCLLVHQLFISFRYCLKTKAKSLKQNICKLEQNICLSI